MTAIDVGVLVVYLVIIGIIGLFVLAVGTSYEAPYCDCPECVKWRPERKAEGEKRDGASDSNF